MSKSDEPDKENLSSVVKKKVDESWKDDAAKEKLKGKEDSSAPPAESAVDFISLISTLSMQAYVGLGILPNPLTDKKEEDLNQSRYIIDTIAMLKEKTQGNLKSEEAKFVGDILYELRTKFIEKTS